MWPIVVKDMRKLPKLLFFALLIFLSLPVLGLLSSGSWEDWKGNAPGIGTWAGVVYVIIISSYQKTIMMEEGNKGVYLLRSLPIAAKTIVLAKFIGVSLALGGGLVFNLLINWLIERTVIQGHLYSLTMYHLVVLELMLLWSGLYLALIFRFGLKNGRTAAGIPPILIAGFFILFAFVSPESVGKFNIFVLNRWWIKVLPFLWFLGALAYSIRSFQDPKALERY